MFLTVLLGELLVGRNSPVTDVVSVTVVVVVVVGAVVVVVRIIHSRSFIGSYG